MPTRARRPCKYPGCPALASEHGFCDFHASKYAGEVDQEQRDRHALYGSRWKRRRKAYLSEHPWCEDCLIGGVWEPATDCHHITPHKGNKMLFYSSDLRALCHPCHSRHTARERLIAAGDGEGA